MPFALSPFIVMSRDGNHSFGCGAADATQAIARLDAMALAGFTNLTCVDHAGRIYSREDLVGLARAPRTIRRTRRKAAPKT